MVSVLLGASFGTIGTANASYDACNSYAGPSQYGGGFNVCVGVYGSYRTAYVDYVAEFADAPISISSLYLRQCSGTGTNCVQIAATSGSGTAYYPAKQNFVLETSQKLYSFGHTYIACFSGYAGSTPYVNYCSGFRTNAPVA